MTSHACFRGPGAAITRLFSLFALALALLFAAQSAAPASAFEGANGRLAFQSRRAGNWEIYTMNPDGSDVVRLTSDAADDERPGWSPDGRQIVFGSRRGGNPDIYVMNADGSGLRRVTTQPGEDYAPQWSADGARIVFRSSRDGNKEIYVMNADGSGQTNLTRNPADDTGPVWSPLGDKIAFSSNRAGNDDVYLMNVDGSGLVRLTTSPANDFAAAWSPDGGRIAFRSERDGNVEIYVMNADGSGQTNVTRHPASDRGPAWSPDGAEIAFYTNRDGNYEIYAIRPDGTGLRRLTNNPADDFSPDWGTAEPGGGDDSLLLPLLISTGIAGTVDGVAFAPADILRYDPADQRWRLYFDASDVGIGANNLTAFTRTAGGALLLVFAKPYTIGGVRGTPQDVLRFQPTALGDATAGTFSLAFDGSAHGLTTTGERIDALAQTPTGGLLFSTFGAASVPGVAGNLRAQREDVIAFVAATGKWTLHYDGTPALGRFSANLGGYAIDSASGERYVTTPKSLTLGGQAVDDRDLLRLGPGDTLSLFWDGSAAGFPVPLDAVEVLR